MGLEEHGSLCLRSLFQIIFRRRSATSVAIASRPGGCRKHIEMLIENLVGNVGWSMKSRSGSDGLFLPSALAFALLLVLTPALAQSPPQEAAGAEQHPPRRYRKVTIDDEVKAFAGRLDLSEAQQIAVKRILEQREQETQRIRRATDDPDRIGQLRALQFRTVERIRNVLNEEQKKKYDPLGHHVPQQTSPQPSVEDWMKATTPH